MKGLSEKARGFLQNLVDHVPEGVKKTIKVVGGVTAAVGVILTSACNPDDDGNVSKVPDFQLKNSYTLVKGMPEGTKVAAFPYTSGGGPDDKMKAFDDNPDVRIVQEGPDSMTIYTDKLIDGEPVGKVVVNITLRNTTTGKSASKSADFNTQDGPANAVVDMPSTLEVQENFTGDVFDFYVEDAEGVRNVQVTGGLEQKGHIDDLGGGSYRYIIDNAADYEVGQVINGQIEIEDEVGNLTVVSAPLQVTNIGPDGTIELGFYNPPGFPKNGEHFSKVEGNYDDGIQNSVDTLLTLNGMSLADIRSEFDNIQPENAHWSVAEAFAAGVDGVRFLSSSDPESEGGLYILLITKNWQGDDLSTPIKIRTGDHGKGLAQARLRLEELGYPYSFDPNHWIQTPMYNAVAQKYYEYFRYSSKPWEVGHAAVAINLP